MNQGLSALRDLDPKRYTSTEKQREEQEPHQHNRDMLKTAPTLAQKH